MIASPNHSARGSTPVRLVVVHTAEGARTKESLGKYFQGNVDASSHVGIDAGGIESYVDYSRASWTLLNGNPISDNAELCAFARWTPKQWMSTSPVDGCANPKAILDNTAAWIRSRCLERGIPIRKLTPAQVDQGMAGVIGHADWTYSAVGQGDHTDPGPNFPWDYVIARAAGGPGGGGANQEEEAMAGWDEKSGLAEEGHEYDMKEIFVGSNRAAWVDARASEAAVEELQAQNEKLDTLIEVMTRVANKLEGK